VPFCIDTFRAIHFCTLQLTGHDYFHAPPDMEADFTDHLAQLRHLPSKKWRHYDLLSTAERRRLNVYISHAGAAKPVINVVQNFGFDRVMGDLVPSLLKGSRLYSVKLDKLMMPQQHWVVQGWPVPRLVEETSGAPSWPLPMNVLTEMKDTHVRSMAGNMFHMRGVGMVLQDIFCFLVPCRAASASGM